VANGLAKRLLPDVEALDGLLRLGYALRIVDEIACEHSFTASSQTSSGWA
jgi:hypothetical protein